jgi:hypothetical protein
VVRERDLMLFAYAGVLVGHVFGLPFFVKPVHTV